ncbi:MAG: DNA polymerase III subunit gamma/tau [Phyllobacteriaceae bacterium]|nr:DNA polymerase III subunit gamma/tau [Phyllobacteriaceae bacterium]
MNDAPAATAATPVAPYRVLARKYRPRDFSDLIGQEPMVRTLTNAFHAGRIAQAWMLTGVRGVGKTTTARILARALNYKTATLDQPTVDLAEIGEHCQAITEGRHVDVIEMDAASHTGVDNMRDLLEQVRYAPVTARYKVYIIDEVHMLSKSAFNALLKTLEEPPPHVKFIFATTEIRKVPITVLSRCQRFDLRRVESAELMTHLAAIAGKEGVNVENDALAMIARAAEGSVRDSLSLLDQAISHGSGRVEGEAVRAMLGLADRARIIDLFEKLMSGDMAGALAEFRAQYDAGGDPAVILSDLAAFTHFVTRVKFIPEAARDATLSENERVRGEGFARQLNVRVLSRAWQMLLKGLTETRDAPRPVDAAEMVLVRIAHAADLPTLDEALADLPAVSAGAAPPAPAPSRPAGGPTGSLAAMRIVESAPALARAPEPAADAAPSVAVTSLADIAALADVNRDMTFKVLLKRNVRLVRIEPGVLEIGLAEGAPRTLTNDLVDRLNRWTGRRWMVTVAREGGGRTLAEQESEKRENAITDARADPAVAALLSAFPGARIVDVRLPAAPAEDMALIADAPPPASESDDETDL